MRKQSDLRQRSSMQQSRSMSVEILDKLSLKSKQKPQNEISDDQNEQKIKIIQTEISDFVVVETGQNGNQYNILCEDDWQRIINQNSIAGFNMSDIHVSLATQNLQFKERRKLWLLFADVDKFKQQCDQENKGYKHYLNQKCKYNIQINKDIKRTSEDLFFKDAENLQSLEHILVAYANFDPELGYTQGMNFVAGCVLMCYDLTNNDEQLEDFQVYDFQRDENVFYIFVNIMIEKNWRSVFMDGFPGLTRMLKVFEYKFKQEIPGLYNHFFMEQASLSLCFQHFYLTLMMYGIDWKFSRTILDLFLFEGEQIIHSFLIAMLKYSKDQLYKKTFPDIVKYCKVQLLQNFYALYENQLNGHKDLTKTLTKLGLIKISDDDQSENEYLDKNYQDEQNEINTRLMLEQQNQLEQQLQLEKQYEQKNSVRKNKNIGKQLAGKLKAFFKYN